MVDLKLIEVGGFGGKGLDDLVDHLAASRQAAERLQEMAGELREEGASAAQPAGYRIENHRPTTEPPDPGRLDRWRREMDAEELAAYEGVAADMLAELGYELGGGR